jgi:nicotinamide riboside kinase
MSFTCSNMKNIYVIGAQSTGKTTLVNALEHSLEDFANRNSNQTPRIIREVARKVLREKNFSREDIVTSPMRALQLQQIILAAQHEAETTTYVRGAPVWYICDRSGLDPIAYARCFVGVDAAAEMLKSEIWLELEGRMKNGIVILCETGCRWLIDDGVRLMPKDMEEWTRVDGTFRHLLETRGIGYSVISQEMVDLEERVKFVRKISEDANKE